MKMNFFANCVRLPGERSGSPGKNNGAAKWRGFMRLAILENGYSTIQKLYMPLIKFSMGHIPGPIRILTYKNVGLATIMRAACKKACANQTSGAMGSWSCLRHLSPS